MKRILLAVMIAILGVAMFGTTANAAGPEQQGRERAGKLLRGGGERIALVAEMLGIEPRMVLRQIRNGATIEELAAGKGVPLMEIQEALAQPHRDRLAAEVEAGVLTQAQADYLSARAEERLNDFLTLSPRRALREPMLDDLAIVLELSKEEIIARMAEGSTPAEMVSASGKSVASVVEELVALKDADLTERVTLDLLTETQKSRTLRAYEQMLTNRLSQ